MVVRWGRVFLGAAKQKVSPSHKFVAPHWDAKNCGLVTLFARNWGWWFIGFSDVYSITFLLQLGAPPMFAPSMKVKVERKIPRGANASFLLSRRPRKFVTFSSFLWNSACFVFVILLGLLRKPRTFLRFFLVPYTFLVLLKRYISWGWPLTAAKWRFVRIQYWTCGNHPGCRCFWEGHNHHHYNI